MVEWTGLRRLVRLMAAVGLAAAVSGCGSFNAATGRWQSVHMTAAQEETIGTESHLRFMDRFDLADAGGMKALHAEVERIGLQLASVSERPDLDWRFYILEDDSVNAFAAAGGRIYLTRGLLAYADEEADIAGVLAHEIGHVTAAHYKDMLEIQPTALARAKEAVEAEIAAEPQRPDPEVVSRRVERAALDAIAAVSQRNELEADVLSTRYLARAGYAPRAALDFMRDVMALQAFSEEEAGVLGVETGAVVFQSHPLSDARVRVTEAALSQAAPLALKADPAGEEAIRQHRDSWLTLLDGVTVERAIHGVVRGGRFGWPDQGFRIDAPRGLTLIATPDGAIGKGAGGRSFYLDADHADLFADKESALDDLRLRLSAAAGRAEAVFGSDARAVRVGRWSGLRVDVPPSDLETSTWLTLVVVDGPEGVIRLIHGGETRSRRTHFRSIRRILRTLRPLRSAEEPVFAPLRLRVEPLRKGETLASIARRAPLYGLGAPVAADNADRKAELALAIRRLRLINGLGEAEEPAIGALIKRYVR